MVRRHVLTVIVAGSIIASATAAQDTRVHVSVADSRNRPVTKLTAADFAVSIDDRPQEIVSVAPASEPVSVVILTDRLGLEPAYGPPDVHRGLAAFVKTVRGANPDSKFALTTFDGPVVRVSTFATPTADFDRLIGRLNTVAPDGALLDALTDACKMLADAPTGRRAIFVLFAAYRPETSNATVERVGEMLRLSEASLWALEVRTTAGQNSFGNANRELVVDRGSRLTGGMRDIVASAVGIESSARRMAELIASQYVVTYRPGGGGANSVRKIGVKGSGLRVYAPSWLAR